MEAPNSAAATSGERHAAAIYPKPAHTSSDPPSMMRDEGGQPERAVRCRKRKPIRLIGSRMRTFDRRRRRLFKAASEISTLCDAEVAAIVFSPAGKMSEFASSSTRNTIRRYQSFQHETPSKNILSQDVKVWKHEGVQKKLKYLEEFQRSVFDKKMPFSISEVKTIETILIDAVTKIRSRKLDLLKVEAQKIIEKGEMISKENHALQQMLAQLISTKEFVNNDSTEWFGASYHQAIFKTTSHDGSAVLQGTKDKEHSFSSKT